MDYGLLSFSFAAGAAAFFNPCGFALLPSYVSYYLGRVESEARPGWGASTLRGLGLGVAVSAGFATAFGVFGVVLAAVGGAVARYFPWLVAAVGAGLIVLGALTLADRSPSLTIPTKRAWGLGFLPRAGARSDGLRFYYVYGISYAVASLSCTIPIFMIVVANAFSGGLLNGLAQYAAYAAGMTAMMVGLSLAMAWSKKTIQRYLSSIQRYVRPASAWVLMAAGAYLIYYNLFYSGLVRF